MRFKNSIYVTEIIYQEDARFMSQDANQNPQNNYPQGQPYEPTQAASPPDRGGQENPPSPAYNPLQPGSPYPAPAYNPTPSGPAPYPDYQTPSSAYGNYGNPSGYPPQPTTGSNPYENASPYASQPQPGAFPQPSPYGTSYPGYQPPQPPKKRKTWLWVTLGVVGGILVISIIACTLVVTSFSSLVKTTANTDATSTAMASNTDVATPESTGTASDNSTSGAVDISPATVGKTNTLQNVDCVVTSVKKVPGDSLAQPKAGDEFIVIHVKITNRSSETEHYNPLDFKVTNSQGKSFTNSYLAPEAYSNQLSFGDLNPSASVDGDLVFEVSSSDHTQTFNWDPTFNDFADNPGVANWTLNI